MHNEAAERLFSRAIDLPISSPRLQLTPSGTAACRPSGRAGRKSISYRSSLRQSQRQPSASHLPIVRATSSLCRPSLHSSSRLVAASPYLSESPYLSAIGVFLPLPNFVSSSRFFRPPCADLQLRPCVIPYTPSPFRQTGQQHGKREALAPFCKSTEKPGAPRRTASSFAKFVCIVVAFGPLP
jgi:hypothetical protein